MKKFGMILALMILLAPGLLSQISLNEKGLYQDRDGALFTGKLESNENGIKTSALEIKEGNLNGEAQYFYASGKLMETGSFENGVKNGKWTRYNESGVTVGLAIFNAGKKNGTWLVWDDTGNKLFEMHYSNGEKTGTWYNWDPSGQLISSKDFSNGN